MMDRREWLATAGALGAALPAEGQTRKPNFVVIMSDDQGSHDLGCYGAQDVKTPHIDGLASSGVRFTNWYSCAPVCAPSRAALQTGRYPVRAGVATNGRPLGLNQHTLASRLKSAGYATGLIGKWHLGDTPETVPNARGYDYFYGFLPGCVDFYSHIFYWGESNPQNRTVNFHSLFRNREEIWEDGQYLTERITEESVGFIEKHKSEPFLLCVTFNAVHYPMHAPEKYKKRFPNLAPERQTYAAMLAAMDDGVGAIRKTLERHGLLENTLIFFVADNGATTEPRAGLQQQPATAGDNGVYRGFKFSLFDGGMHVPGIMSWPARIKAGQVGGEQVMTMDIAPTIWQAAGVPPEAGYTVDGRDILPVATQGAKSPHGTIYWENGQQAAARKGKWKLVLKGNEYGRTAETRGELKGDDAVWLSDLEADPGERRNVRHEHPQIADELQSAIHAWKEDTRK
jgi:arylsulfatase A-like enzyme